MASIAELTGIKKVQSDLEQRRIKVRYNNSTTVEQGQYFRITLPKIGDAVLDMRDVRLHFNLDITSSDVQCTIAAPDVRCLINKMRILSGSTVLCDLVEFSQAAVFESLIHTSDNENIMTRYAEGRQPLATRQTYGLSREYTCPINLRGGLLNMNGLLPLSRCSDIHVEFWLNAPGQALYSGTDGAATYKLRNIELLTTYVTSPSLSQHFNSSSVNFNVTDVTHRYNPVLSQQTLLRLSSNHNSLNSLITIMRTQANVDSIDVADKYESWYSGTNIEKYNTFVNNVLLYEEDVDSGLERWRLIQETIPEMHTSEHFDVDYLDSKSFLAVNLQSCRHFADRITSGVKTSAHNSDIVKRVNLTAIPVAPVRADSYLYSDAVISLGPRGGDLKISY